MNDGTAIVMLSEVETYNRNVDSSTSLRVTLLTEWKRGGKGVIKRNS